MKVNRIRQNVFPVLAALIWGTAFVAQSMGGRLCGPLHLYRRQERGGLCIPVGAVSGASGPAEADFRGEAAPRPGSRRTWLWAASAAALP